MASGPRGARPASCTHSCAQATTCSSGAARCRASPSGVTAESSAGSIQSSAMGAGASDSEAAILACSTVLAMRWPRRSLSTVINRACRRWSA